LPQGHFHCASGFYTPKHSHACWTPWSVFQDGSLSAISSTSLARWHVAVVADVCAIWSARLSKPRQTPYAPTQHPPKEADRNSSVPGTPSSPAYKFHPLARLATLQRRSSCTMEPSLTHLHRNTALHTAPQSHAGPFARLPHQTRHRVACLTHTQVRTGAHRFPVGNFTYCLTLSSECFSTLPQGTCSLSVSR